MFLSPYQHGVVRVIKEAGRFEPANPQFQHYQYATHDLVELVDAMIVEYIPKQNVYVPGLKWSIVK